MEDKLVQRFNRLTLVVKIHWLDIIIGTLGHILRPAITIYSIGKMTKIVFELFSFTFGIRFSYGEEIPYCQPLWEIKILTPIEAKRNPFMIWAF